MNVLETILGNATEISFGFLFVWLLWSTNKRNDDREDKYQKREEKYQEIINRQSQALGAMEDVREKIDMMHSEFVKARIERESQEIKITPDTINAGKRYTLKSKI